MRPNEIKCLNGRKVGGIAGIEALMDVEREAWNAEFPAHITARPGAAHRIAYQSGLEVAQQVADQIAAAIAGIASVAVFTGTVKVIEAGQVRDGTGRSRGTR
jgi:hypothetical protein